MEGRWITVAEIEPFSRQADLLLTTTERERLIDYVAQHPESGDLIPGTGGLRKLRWKVQGTGKRGGVRLIYYFYNEDWPVLLLTLYRKSRQEDLRPEEKKKLRNLVEILKGEMRQRERG